MRADILSRAVLLLLGRLTNRIWLTLALQRRLTVAAQPGIRTPFRSLLLRLLLYHAQAKARYGTFYTDLKPRMTASTFLFQSLAGDGGGSMPI